MQMLGVKSSVGAASNQWLSGDTKFGSLTMMMTLREGHELPTLTGRSPFQPSHYVQASVQVTGAVSAQDV
jgi:hypothetical protein